jgi:hypothetical protein
MMHNCQYQAASELLLQKRRNAHLLITRSNILPSPVIITHAGAATNRIDPLHLGASLAKSSTDLQEYFGYWLKRINCLTDLFKQTRLISQKTRLLHRSSIHLANTTKEDIDLVDARICKKVAVSSMAPQLRNLFTSLQLILEKLFLFPAVDVETGVPDSVLP